MPSRSLSESVPRLAASPPARAASAPIAGHRLPEGFVPNSVDTLRPLPLPIACPKPAQKERREDKDPVYVIGSPPGHIRVRPKT